MAAEARRQEVLALLPKSVTVLGEEIDGRSQPLFLREDIETEKHTTDGISQWDPSTAPERVLVTDTAAPDPAIHFGSYFVFRKPEQNVRLFKQEELTAPRAPTRRTGAWAGKPRWTRHRRRSP